MACTAFFASQEDIDVSIGRQENNSSWKVRMIILMIFLTLMRMMTYSQFEKLSFRPVMVSRFVGWGIGWLVGWFRERCIHPGLLIGR